MIVILTITCLAYYDCAHCSCTRAREMWCLLVICIIFSSSCQAEVVDLKKYREILASRRESYADHEVRGVPSDYFSLEARYVGGTNVAASTVRYIVSVIEQAPGASTFTMLGPGVIVNKYWVILNAIAANSVSVQEDMLVVVNADVMGDTTSAGLLIRRVKGMNFYAADTTANIALLKICPGITDSSYYAPLPTATFQYNIGTAFSFYTYVPQLHKFDKTIASMAGCSSYDSAFSRPRTFCSNIDQANKLENSDLRGAIAIVNNVFAGFTIARGSGAEMFIRLADYITWVNANTPTN